VRQIGFSTGALCKSDFRRALAVLEPHNLPCIELSALRMHEVVPLLDALEALDLGRYRTISFHAPGKYEKYEELELSQMLFEWVPADWPIIMHPDAIWEFAHWRRFGRRLAIENMDRRKPVGRNVSELNAVFAQLPDASLCFDIGHARQFDSSMTEAFLILMAFRDRLVQVHISEVNSESQHDAISYGAKLSFQQVANMIDERVPIILESRVGQDAISSEIRNALDSLSLNSDSRKNERTLDVVSNIGSLMRSFS
jgi:hypothetical protein